MAGSASVVLSGNVVPCDANAAAPIGRWCSVTEVTPAAASAAVSTSTATGTISRPMSSPGRTAMS
jgi:hypothetical protein